MQATVRYTPGDVTGSHSNQMKSTIFVFIFCALSCAHAISLGHSGESLKVTMIVFSGDQNPEWTLSSSDADVLRTIHGAKAFASVPSGSNRVMGYRGFVVTTNSGETSLVAGAFHEEIFLLNSGNMQHVLSYDVYAHARDEINALARSASSNNRLVGLGEKCGASNGAMCFTGLGCVCSADDCKCVDDKLDDVVSNVNDADCNHEVKGPDTVPKFDPKTDNGGCFITRQYDNNCYAYGSDDLTNTFPQPGRGSGHKWEENTCDDIRASAERDGLTWIGSTLPDSDPKEGHYIALLIWPNSNFHWIRKDSNGKWSHKPGGTPVKNTDNNGNLITDPSKQDFSPWSQFCGYMQVVPSKIKIN